MFWSGKESNEEFEEELWGVAKSGPLVLDVGCGTQKVDPSLVGVDAYAEGPMVNIKAYMWDMPFEDDSVDGLICMSALEHVSKYQVLPALYEFKRVLKPGAKFIILVPDLDFVLRSFLEKPNVEWEMDMLFGIQTHEGEFHRTGFTETIFHQYFDEIFKEGSGKILNIYKVNAYRQINLGIVAQKAGTRED